MGFADKGYLAKRGFHRPNYIIKMTRKDDHAGRSRQVVAQDPGRALYR
jgi:hypothetical protein